MKDKDTKLTAEQIVEYLYRPTTNISGVAKVLGIQKHTLYNGIARWRKTGEFPDAKWVSEMSGVILDALRMPAPVVERIDQFYCDCEYPNVNSEGMPVPICHDCFKPIR